MKVSGLKRFYRLLLSLRGGHRELVDTDRTTRLLSSVDKSGFGVEIGPSYGPVAPKKEGYKVHIIDHMNRQGLIEKYRRAEVPIENIEEVDFVWHGEPYAELTGNPAFYDWIIASHVAEHTPDLIGFLNECDSILNERGILSLAIPDCRYCFDCFRPISGISRIIDAHFSNHKVHTPGTAAEHTLNFVFRDGEMAWQKGLDPEGHFTFGSSLDDARTLIDKAVKGECYDDYHAWCFTPHSFRLMVDDLFHLRFIRLREVCFFPTLGFEFYITVSRNGSGPKLSRMEMVKAIKSEISG